jgi:phage terminase large subunit
MKIVGYEIRGAAEKAWRCKDAEVLVDGPAGTGKTTGLLLKALAVSEKYPGARILLVRKTRASMTQSVLVTLEDKLLGPGHPLIGNVKRENRTSYRHPNGSTIVIGGLDNVDRVMSTDYDMIIVFEATEISEHEFETLTPRLRNHVVPYQQMIMDCNPEGRALDHCTRAEREADAISVEARRQSIAVRCRAGHVDSVRPAVHWQAESAHRSPATAPCARHLGQRRRHGIRHLGRNGACA